MKRTTFKTLQKKCHAPISWLAIFVMLFVFGSIDAFSQTTYYSKSTATDFNNVSSWGTGTDGTGTAPASISNADNFIVANSATMTLSANATVRQLTVNAGSLTVSANTLTVSKAGTFDSSFTVNTGGTFAISGGAITVNGNVLFASGSNFNQSGGTFTVDGNNAGLTTDSVATGTPTFAIGSTGTSYSAGTISLTGGKIIIVDPTPGTAADYAFFINLSSNALNITAGTNHTLQIGDGVSTDAGGNATNGYRIYFWNGTGAFRPGKFVVNAPAGVNRHVFQQYRAIFGDVTVTSGELRLGSTDYTIAGNLLVEAAGILTSISPITFSEGTYTGSTTITYAPATVAQTISGAGVFNNAATASTANFASVIINNTSAGGVTFIGKSNIATQPANSVSISSTLTLTAGRIATTGGASFILGNSTPSAGTLNYTSGGFASGMTFGRWYTATGTGTTITAAADATGAGGRYPFVNANNLDRSASIERVTPAGAAGILAVTYTAGAGTTTISVTDGATPIDRKGNDTWAVSVLNGTPTAAASFELQLLGPGTFGAPLVTAGTRIIQGAAFAGTHQAGTVTPGGQRVLSAAELVAAPFSIAASSTDLPYVSVASGDWNSPATWSTGVVPTCTDVVNIGAGTTVTVNSAGAVSKNTIVVAGATLIVASGDLTVGCTLNNNTFTNNGTLTVTGGTLTVNGSMNHTAGSTFNQSGGTIIVDGNDAGIAANSVASGTAIVQLSSQFVNLTGGTLTIVDPHANSTASNTLAYTNSTAHANATGTHTLRFGNGTSTDAGGNATNGFRIHTFVGSNRISFNNVVLDNGAGTNRFVSTAFSIGINGNLTINAGSEFRDSGNLLYVNGNIQNNGLYISTSTLYMGSFLNGTAAASTNAQTFSGTGVYSNNVTPASATANLTSLNVNNTNVAGVTLGGALSLSGTLTLTAGKLNTTTANLLTVGTATAAGTVTGGSATAYVNGPLARTIATANANTNYIAFPVGKTAYAPVFLAPATTAVTVMKAEAFDTNTGTADPSIINLPATRRWEAPVVSGTITNLNVRLGDANITATKIPVMAPTAAGAYAASFGSVATYVAGTPNTTQSNSVVTAANYTGFLSFADSNSCSGTPAPGNTIVSANNICLGTSVNFSVQNATTGSGVSYQWQTSPDDTAYTDIATATSATFTGVPSASLFYRLRVTCATGPAIGFSTPVQITFSNSVTASTGATRCGAGSVTLNATPSAGASVQWFAAATGGSALGTGTAFVTPSIATTTTFYAGAQTPTTGTAAVGTATTTTTTSEELSAFNNRRVSLKSQTIYTAAQLTAAGILPGNIVSIAYNIISNGSATTNTNYTVKMGTTANATFSNTTYLNDSGFTTVYGPATYTHAVGLNTITFTTPFPWDGTSNIVISVSQNGIDSSSNAETLYTDAGANVALFNFNDLAAATGTTSTKRLNVTFGGQVACGSARVPVIATVNTPPTLTLSAAPAAICSGQSTTPVTITAGAADYDTYVWSPLTGISGNAATGWTFNPATTTTYTLAASQSTGSMCVAPNLTVLVSVNPLPSTMSIAAAPVTACAESATPLTVTGGIISGTAVIGTATTLTTDTEQPTAFCNRWPNYWSQTIYTAAELTAAGLTPGNITSLAFNIATLGDGATNDNYTIMIGSVASTSFASTTFLSTTGFTTVYGPQTYTHTASGQQVITFTTPYPWDGVSNIVVNITHDGADSINNSQTYFTATTADTVLWKDSFTGTTTTGTLSKKRLNVTFQSSNILPVTWLPVTNLYTNAAATTAYTVGTNAKTVYYKSSVAAPAVTYTATATTASSCTRTATVDVVTVSTPAPTVPAPTQDICNAGTVANLFATGTAIKWYAGPTGGAPLASTVALVNGTIYYASQTANGCESLTRTALTANINVVAAPTVPNATPEFCNAATVADLLPNGADIKWYAGPTGGTALASTDALVSGTPYYASQTINGCEGLLRATVTPTINVVPTPLIDNAEQTFCNAATIADLLPNGANIKWYSSTISETALLSTDVLVSGTPYFASQTIDGCESIGRGMAIPTINITAAPTGDDIQEFCDAATVAELTTATGENIIWYDAETAGNVLAADAALADGVMYYASQTIDGCESIERLEVMAAIYNVVADAPADVSVCTTYELPVLVNGAYYTEANGQGTALAAGTAITQTATIYVYNAEGLDITCSAENSFVVTVANVPAPTGDNTQTISTPIGTDVTIEDIEADVVANGTITWYATEEDAMAGENPLAANTVIAQNATYYATQTVDTCTSVDVFAVLVDIVLDRDGFDVKAFTYHPNPVQNVLNISYSSEITSVTVFNLLGQLVISQQSNANDVRVDMSSLADGAYVVNVTAGATVKTIKVIKKQ